MTNTIKDQYPIYKKKILKEHKVKYPIVKRGQIIRFEYDGGTDEEIFPELVFVLTARWLQKMHGIKLNVLPYLQFEHLLKKIKSEQPDIVKKAIAEMRVPTDIIINSPKLFYRTYLKTNPEFHKYNPYRIYDIKKIKNVFLIDFDYGKMDDVDSPPKKGSGLDTRGNVV